MYEPVAMCRTVHTICRVASEQEMLEITTEPGLIYSTIIQGQGLTWGTEWTVYKLA